MNILITGNQGYIGPCVVRHLRQTMPKVRIIGFDAGYFRDCLLAPRVLPDAKANVQVSGDVRTVPDHVLRGVDAVVHLAGISNDPIGSAFEAVTMAINCDATAALAAKAKRAGVQHFVFASSCSVYGAAEDGPRDERSAVNPLTAYAKSKIRAEEQLAELAAEDFPVTCLRFATACGLSPRLRLDLVLNDFVANAVTTGRVRILSDGSPWRPLIAVSDMARAVEWAIGRPAGNGGPFLAINTGSNAWNFQVRDLAEAVAQAVPGAALSINRDAQPDKRSYRVSFDLFRSLAPHHQAAATLEGTIRELRAGLAAAGVIAPARFVRLQTLMGLRERGQLGPDLCWQYSAVA